jgi:hypothetical protein
MRLSSAVMGIVLFSAYHVEKRRKCYDTSPTSSDGFWELAGLND